MTKVPDNYIRKYDTETYGVGGAEEIFIGHQELLKETIAALDPQVRKALDIYISWLRQPGEYQDEMTFTIEDFFRWEESHLPDGHYNFGLLNETHVRADLRIDATRYITMSAGTGDEGGPAQLYILIDEQYDNASIIQITQEFDTNYSLVYFAGEGKTKGIVPFSWSPQEASGETPQA